MARKGPKKGYKQSSEHIKKRIEKTANTRKLRGKYVPWNKGKTGVYNEDTIKKISQAKKRNPTITPQLKGADNPFWKGGLSAAYRRHYSKRKGYGFDPLNESFEGCAVHHLDRVHVIHIPKELHTAIPHRQDDDSINIINILAMTYLECQCY